MNKISYIVLCSKKYKNIFDSNFKKSPPIKVNNNELLVIDNFSLEYPCVSLNKAIDAAMNNVIVFAQADVYLPNNWDINLLNIIRDIENKEINWAVLGIWGASKGNEFVGHLYSNGLQKELGRDRSIVEAKSLDETIIILNKKTGVRFDDNFPNLFLYGNDLLLSASKMNFKNYIICNYFVHNSTSHLRYFKNALKSIEYFRKKWPSELPFITPYVTVYPNKYKNIHYKIKQDIKYFLPLYKRTLNLIYRRHEDPSSIFPKVLKP